MINWTLTEQQADQVLFALGQRPFLEVNGLIGELMKQGQAQVQARQEQQVGQPLAPPQPNGSAIAA